MISFRDACRAASKPDFGRGSPKSLLVKAMPWCFAPVESKHDACRNATEFAVENSVLAATASPENVDIFQCLLRQRRVFIPARKVYHSSAGLSIEKCKYS